MKKDDNVRIYKLKDEDVLDVIDILSKGKKLEVLEAREDCNVVICKVNRKIYFFSDELYNALLISQVLTD